MCNNSTYLNVEFTNYIDVDSINTIVECGSRDCLDAIEMNKYYKPEIIYSFECNPESIPVCLKNIEDIKNIYLIPKAVYNENKIVVFYATDMEKSIDKNIGASSLLKNKDTTGDFIQKIVLVEATRLDTFMEEEEISCIDLLCMDLQGTEHIAIEGLGDRVKDVKYVISEVSKKSYYFGDMLFDDFKEFMRGKGFRVIAKDKSYTGNALFKNVNYEY